MRPGFGLAAFGLVEPTQLCIFFGIGLNQKHGPVFVPVIEAAVGASDRAFAGLGFLPHDFAGLEIEADQVGCFAVAAVCAIQISVDQYHASVMVLHFLGG